MMVHTTMQFLHVTFPCLSLPSADDNVRKIFDLEFASRKEKSKHEMASIVEKYRRSEGDTGSLEVQGIGELAKIGKGSIVNR